MSEIIDNTSDIPVGSLVYVSPNGYEYMKKYHENLIGYCFTSKVQIIDAYDSYDFDDEMIRMYECHFENDPNRETNTFELSYLEVSFNPLRYFDVKFEPGEICNDDFNNGQLAMKLVNDGKELEVGEVEKESPKLNSELSEYEQKALKIGNTVTNKQKAYGNAVVRSNEVLQAFMKPYFNGVTKTYNIPEDLFLHMQILVRTIDKWNRIINNPKQDLMSENTYDDITGYGLLGSILSKR
jgi:hypothetical protein